MDNANANSCTFHNPIVERPDSLTLPIQHPQATTVLSVRSIQYTEEFARNFDLLLAAIAQIVLWQTIIRKTDDDVGACSGDFWPKDAAKRATAAVAFMDGFRR